MPIGSEDKLVGLVDLTDRQAYHFLGASGEQVPPPPLPPPPTHRMPAHACASCEAIACQHSLHQRVCGHLSPETGCSCEQHGHPALDAPGVQEARSPASPQCESKAIALRARAPRVSALSAVQEMRCIQHLTSIEPTVRWYRNALSQLWMTSACNSVSHPPTHVASGGFQISSATYTTASMISCLARRV